MVKRLRSRRLFPALASGVILALSSCVYPVPEPVEYAYVGPVPPPGPYRRCGSAWHWVRGHYGESGRWVSGHCARNWVNPSAAQRNAPPGPPTEPAAPAAPPE